MRKLRTMHNKIPNSTIHRDRQMQAWALSNSLSRNDMAVAVGLVKSRIDQIIRDLTLLDQARNAQEAYERLRQHMPPELLREALAQNPALDPDYPWHEQMGDPAD
jgi:DNA-binding PucR family transcriptional regulator